MLSHLRLALVIVALPSVSALARDTVISAQSRPGVTQRVIFIEPAGPARAVVVAWPSGDGVIGLTDSGMSHTDAFFPRASARFVAAGLPLAIADAPSDKPSGLDYDFRVRAEHVADVAAAIAAVRTLTNLPIFLAGFSRGTLSVTNAAARLEPGTIAGVILASSVTVRAGIARKSVYDTPLAEIGVPVFVLGHRDDDCFLTPASGVPALLQAFTAAPRKESRILSGGSASSGGCFAHTPHDFLGSEDQAVEAMTTWINSVLGSR
jgi:hypothetical protein